MEEEGTKRAAARKRPRSPAAPAGPARRTRRTSAEARQRILEAAEVRLAEGGPDAVKIQPLAADLGITDAAIYHHFRNREGLLDALARFGARRLRDSMEEVVARQAQGTPDVQALVELALQTFEARGYSRLVLWLAAAGTSSDRGSGMFEAIVSAFEAARPPRAKGASNPRFLAALMVMVCASEPLFGDMSRRSVGLVGTNENTRRFREWFASTIAVLLGSNSKS
jgi:AcrR family transcriptional regulator